MFFSILRTIKTSCPIQIVYQDKTFYLFRLYFRKPKKTCGKTYKFLTLLQGQRHGKGNALLFACRSDASAVLFDDLLGDGKT